jgi:hypothetical protein
VLIQIDRFIRHDHLPRVQTSIRRKSTTCRLARPFSQKAVDAWQARWSSHRYFH